MQGIHAPLCYCLQKLKSLVWKQISWVIPKAVKAWKGKSTTYHSCKAFRENPAQNLTGYSGFKPHPSKSLSMLASKVSLGEWLHPSSGILHKENLCRVYLLSTAEQSKQSCLMSFSWMYIKWQFFWVQNLKLGVTNSFMFSHNFRELDSFVCSFSESLVRFRVFRGF